MNYTIILYIIIGVLLAFVVTAVYADFFGAPFMPLSKKYMPAMLALAQIRPGEKVVDLGSGDGRLVIAAYRRYRAKAVGVEFALLPWLWSNINILCKGLRGQVIIKWGDMYKADISQVDVVLLYLFPGSTRRLKDKLQKELPPGARVVSFAFCLDKPVAFVRDKRTIYLYQKKERELVLLTAKKVPR